jgi:hypothetical protein
MLRPPGPAAYGRWCDAFFVQCARHLGYLAPLSEPRERARIVAVLEGAFAGVAPAERVMRIWIKLAALAPAILLCGAATSVEALEAEMKRARADAAGPRFPWDG